MRRQPESPIAVRTATLVGLVVLVAALPTAAGAATYLVDSTGNGDFLTIQEGLSACALWDTVKITPGVYKGEGNRDLVPVSGTTIIGLGGPSSTVIDCEFAGKGFELDTVRLCVFVGLTIRNGDSMQGTFPRTAGGAVYSFDSDPTFIDCVFADCYAPLMGGGVYSQGDGPTFERCVFAGNETGYETSGYGGGGLCVRWVLGECVIKSCIFRDNRTGRSGGAAYLYPVHGSVVIDSTLFIGNSCEKWGGALYFSGGTADVANCTFVKNSAGEQGSAVNGSYSPDLLVQRCILSFGLGGGVVSGSGAFEQCCLFANAGGDTLPGGAPGYIVGNPLFCDLPLGDLSLDASSPCLPPNNDWGVLIGALPHGCGLVVVEEVSWGHIKSLYR